MLIPVVRNSVVGIVLAWDSSLSYAYTALHSNSRLDIPASVFRALDNEVKINPETLLTLTAEIQPLIAIKSNYKQIRISNAKPDIKESSRFIHQSPNQPPPIANDKPINWLWVAILVLAVNSVLGSWLLNLVLVRQKTQINPPL